MRAARIRSRRLGSGSGSGRGVFSSISGHGARVGAGKAHPGLASGDWTAALSEGLRSVLVPRPLQQWLCARESARRFHRSAAHLHHATFNMSHIETLDVIERSSTSTRNNISSLLGMAHASTPSTSAEYSVRSGGSSCSRHLARSLREEAQWYGYAL